MSEGQTPMQTLGPFFHQGLVRAQRMFHLPELCSRSEDIIGNLLAPGQEGQRVRLAGAVYDGLAAPVTDALIEIWQADADGRYPSAPGATIGRPRPEARKSPSERARWGFGRAPTDARGEFWFETIKPGGVFGAGGRSAPHVNVIVGARGMSRQAFTRLYFEGDDAALGADPVLALVPPERRHTLIARLSTAAGTPTYRFDIRLQGEGETVFFDF